MMMHSTPLQGYDKLVVSAWVQVAGEGGQRGQAGAVAAAARELRPVEIVGLYESQKETLEVGCCFRHSAKRLAWLSHCLSQQSVALWH